MPNIKFLLHSCFLQYYNAFFSIVMIPSCYSYHRVLNKIYRRTMTRNTIVRYYNNTEITSLNELPVPYDERTPTDVFCTVCTAIFAIAMLIFSVAILNLDTLRSMTYPTDSMGRRCTLDNSQYNFLYFVDPDDITRRVCVQECPKGSDSSLSCLPTDNVGCEANQNQGFEVFIYESSHAEDTSLGLFCFPEDEQLKEKILLNSNLDVKYKFIKAFRLLFIFAGVSVGLSILFLVGSFISPMVILYCSIVLGGLGFLLLSGLLFYESTKELKAYSALFIILALVMVAIAVMLLSALCLHKDEIGLAVKYLNQAVDVMKNEPGLFLLIPIFIACTIGLFALCAFQHLSFWSKSELVFYPEEVFYSPEGKLAVFMQFLNLIEFIWGLCFLKAAFSYLVAGCGVTYYLWKESYFTFGLKGFFCYHWGSVVGGSFLINFFFIPDLIFDFIRPNEDKNPGGYKTFTEVCCLCDRIFGLVREESMAFINMVGMPYCNSSRVTERIYFLNNDPIDGSESQSVGRYFRLGGHTLICTISFAIFFFYMNQEGKVYLPILLFSYLINIFVSTYFVCLLADMSESLLMCELISLYLNNENQRAVDSGKGKNRNDLAESNVNEGYEVMPTNPY